MDKIFTEENKIYSFDFSNALWATEELNKLFTDAKTELCDVDFIAEDETDVLFIEYKNSNIENAANPGAFNPLEDKRISQVVKKYYDSSTYTNAIGVDHQKKKIYIYILEAPAADSVLRNRVKTRLKKLLPFLLQENNQFNYNLIDDVKVISIDQWNESYPMYPISKITV